MLWATLGRRGGAPGGTVELPYSSLTATRPANDVGNATVTVPTGSLGGATATALADALAWRDELTVWDDTDDSEPLWVGPLQPPTYTRDTVVLPVRDLWAWFDHRTLEHDRTYRDVDLGIIFTAHAADALRRDPSPLITVTPTSVGIGGDRAVKAAQHLNAGDAMRELCRSGVDFTMAGRVLLLSSARVPGGRLPPLADHLVEAPTTGSPADTATEVTVLGATRADGHQVTGTASVDAPPQGLLQAVVNEPAVLDGTSARHAAQAALDASTGLPFTATVTGWTSLRRIVPNMLTKVAVQVGVLTLLGDYRVTSATFSAAADGAPGVSVTFVPVEV